MRAYFLHPPFVSNGKTRSRFHRCTKWQGIFVTREHVLISKLAIAHRRNSRRGGVQSIFLSAFEKEPLAGVRLRFQECFKNPVSIYDHIINNISEK
jgi:hypothetical protein